ncbi:hypothetical protein QQ045_020920 [Rhodiola kirilowii]
MGRRRAALLFNQILRSSDKLLPTSYVHKPTSSLPRLGNGLLNPKTACSDLGDGIRCLGFSLRVRAFTALPSAASDCAEEDVGESGATSSYELVQKVQEEEAVKIPVKAFFLCTSIDLKSMQAENQSNVIPATSRSSNYLTLKYYDYPSMFSGIGVESNARCSRFMIVSQYGSVVMFNIEDHEVESYLKVVRIYSSGLLTDIKKDDFSLKENPLLDTDMQGGPDCVVLKTLDTDSIRVIGTVLGQSIALDYFVSQIDSMLEIFTDINRGMEKDGTFTMDRRKLFQLVGKANSHLADVILKVGLFERSEIAWRDAKYAQIYDYLREEFEVAQRFSNLDFKLKFVEHNIHFLQEVLQNRKSDFLEWCIIFLLTIENIIGIYEIIHESGAVLV